MTKWHIFFIMWISWAWKGTLIENLKKQKEIDLFFVRSYVTRPMREWEIEGNIYNFISLKNFELAIKNNEFLEYELNHGLHYYGTKYRDVIDEWIEKWNFVIKEIEVKWLKSIFLNHPELKKYITSIFLDISEKTLEARIKKRWAYMSHEELKNRKKSLKLEKIESKIMCDCIIETTNNSKLDTLREALEIISGVIWKNIK